MQKDASHEIVINRNVRGTVPTYFLHNFHLLLLSFFFHLRLLQSRPRKTWLSLAEWSPPLWSLCHREPRVAISFERVGGMKRWKRHHRLSRPIGGDDKPDRAAYEGDKLYRLSRKTALLGMRYSYSPSQDREPKNETGRTLSRVTRRKAACEQATNQIKWTASRTTLPPPPPR